MVIIKYNCSYFPRSAIIEISNVCNLDCIHCYLDKSKKYVLDVQTGEDLIDQLSKLGCFKLVFTGGEVFVHRNTLLNLVEKAKKMDFEVTVITNATLCTYEDIQWLSNVGLDSLNVSLYGINEESYKRITGSCLNVEEIKQKVLFARDLGINVTVLSAGLNSLYFDLLELQRWCKEKDIPFNIAYVIYGKESGCQLAESLSEDRILGLLEHDDRIFSIVNGQERQQRSAKSFCAAGAHTICIAANGNVYPCANWRVKAGSIYDDTILEIWNNSKKLLQIRECLFESFVCSSCDKFDICPVCPGVNYSTTGDAHTPSAQICKYTDALFKCRQNREVHDEDSINSGSRQ